MDAWDDKHGWGDEDEDAAMKDGWFVLDNQTLPGGVKEFAIRAVNGDHPGMWLRVFDQALKGNETATKAVLFIIRYSPHHLAQIAENFPYTVRATLMLLTNDTVTINYNFGKWWA